MLNWLTRAVAQANSKSAQGYNYGMGVNPLHLRIGKTLSEYLNSRDNVRLLRDVACGGSQHIPLFCSERKSRETEYFNVDMMILKGNKIKVIIEVEESNVKPTQVCGKFLTSALSKHYLHHSGKAEMDQSVTFIQILDTSALVQGKQRRSPSGVAWQSQ